MRRTCQTSPKRKPIVEKTYLNENGSFEGHIRNKEGKLALDWLNSLSCYCL